MFTSLSLGATTYATAAPNVDPAERLSNLRVSAPEWSEAAAAAVCTSTCYVNAATGSDGFDGNTPVTAKKTIQAAVSTVQAGGQVVVSAGIYTESLMITHSLQLLGAGVGLNPAAATILTPDSSGIRVRASGVTLKNLTVANTPAPGSGVVVDASQLPLANVTIDGVWVTSNAGNGIAVSGAGGVSNLVVRGTTLAQNGTPSAGGAGLVVAAGTPVSSLTITGSQIISNVQFGLAGGAGLAGLTVDGTTFMGNGALFTDGTSESGEIGLDGFNGSATLTNLHLTGGARPTGGGPRLGIQLAGGSPSAPGLAGNLTLSNILIDGHYRRPGVYGGIGLLVANYSGAAGFTMKGVTIDIRPADAQAAATNLMLTNVAGDLSVGNSEFGGQATADLVLNQSRGGVDATQASFNHVAMPAATLDQLYAAADRVVDAVDIAVAGLVRLRTGNVYLTPLSFAAPATAAPSIQRAVDAAAAGDTVNVQAGIYRGQVTVTRSLRLIGTDGAAVTIIQAPGVVPPADSMDSNLVKLSGAGAQIELAGFTVSGPGPGACNSLARGIFVVGAAAYLHDNRVVDIRDQVLSACPSGSAVQVGSTGFAVTGTATIRNNFVAGYQKNGITVSGSGSHALIEDNTVQGAGPTGIVAQNGIQVSGQATATIADNVISGNLYTGTDVIGTGVLVFNASADSVDNDVVNNTVGLYLVESSGEHTGNTIQAPAPGVASFVRGVIVDAPPPGPQPSPLATGPAASEASRAHIRATAEPARTALTTLDQNTITGSGANEGIGVFAAAGFGETDIALTVSQNWVAGWQTGVSVAQCTGVSCSSSLFTTVSVQRNSITGNEWGFTNFDALPFDARCNWYGAAGGPNVAGERISDAIYTAPWLTTDDLNGPCALPQLAVHQVVNGPGPAQPWQFAGPTGVFSLPAAGGVTVLPDLLPGHATITETLPNGYGSSVLCSDGSTGSNSVEVDLGISGTVTCTFVAAPLAAIVVEKRVGLLPTACQGQSQIEVEPGAAVYFCIVIHNTGAVVLANHIVSDPSLNIDTVVDAPLAPGDTLTITNGSVAGLGPVSAQADFTNTVFVASTMPPAGLEGSAGSVALTYPARSAAQARVTLKDPRPSGTSGLFIWLPAIRKDRSY